MWCVLTEKWQFCETDNGHEISIPAVHAYLERIRRFAKCGESCFVVALIYIDRIVEMRNIAISNLNVHRIVITRWLLCLISMRCIFCIWISLFKCVYCVLAVVYWLPPNSWTICFTTTPTSPSWGILTAEKLAGVGVLDAKCTYVYRCVGVCCLLVAETRTTLDLNLYYLLLLLFYLHLSFPLLLNSSETWSTSRWRCSPNNTLLITVNFETMAIATASNTHCSKRRG